jgi:hypothetical protein
MKEITDDEMNEFILKYVISSVIKRNFENAITDITNLKQNYTQYDLTIYTFFLKFISGAFREAFDDCIMISNNLYDPVWNLINENDLALYFTITLLISFNRKILKEVQSQSSILIYNVFQGDYEEYHNFLENYAKCRYDFVTDEFQKFKRKLLSDPLVMNNLIKINYEVKTNILREILNSCSKVGLNYLSKILYEKDIEKIENWILSGISEGYYRVKIDDIDKIVYSDQQELLNENISNVVDLSKRVYNQSIIKIMNSIVSRVEIKEIHLDEFKKYRLEKVKGREHREGDH